MFTELCHFWAI